jgi:hypothetical protein
LSKTIQTLCRHLVLNGKGLRSQILGMAAADCKIIGELMLAKATGDAYILINFYTILHLPLKDTIETS